MDSHNPGSSRGGDGRKRCEHVLLPVGSNWHAGETPVRWSPYKAKFRLMKRVKAIPYSLQHGAVVGKVIYHEYENDNVGLQTTSEDLVERQLIGLASARITHRNRPVRASQLFAREAFENDLELLLDGNLRGLHKRVAEKEHPASTGRARRRWLAIQEAQAVSSCLHPKIDIVGPSHDRPGLEHDADPLVEL